MVLQFGIVVDLIDNSISLIYAMFSRRTDKDSQVSKPNSARAAGAGGSSSTMLKLYTDDSPGLKV